MKRYSVLDAMPFGQYKGTLIGSIIEEDPRYMAWIVDERGALNLDEEALEYLREFMD